METEHDLADAIALQIKAGFDNLADQQDKYDQRNVWRDRLLGGFGAALLLVASFFFGGGMSFVSSVTTLAEKVSALEKKSDKYEERCCMPQPNRPAFLEIDDFNHFLTPTDQAVIAATGGPLR